MLGVFLLLAFARLGHEFRIFRVCMTEFMCEQTRPWFILSSEKVLGNGVRIHVNSKGKNPSMGISEADQTHDATSHRTASPRHY